MSSSPESHESSAPLPDHTLDHVLDHRPLSAKTVANYFLRLAGEENSALDPMQLLKLVYLAHGWMLGYHHQKLIREPVEAWQYGPVVADLYDSIRHYKGREITETIPAPIEAISDEAAAIINRTYQTYKGKRGVYLSALTHMPGTPWSQIHDLHGDWSVIPNEVIEKYYSDKIQAAKK